MADNDALFGVHENRVIEPKLRNTRGDLRHMRIQVRAWISGKARMPCCSMARRHREAISRPRNNEAGASWLLAPASQNDWNSNVPADVS